MAGNWNVYYYDKADGVSPVKNHIDALPLRERAKTLAFIGLLETTGRIYRVLTPIY
jgi:hypothetical protein